MNSYLVEIFGDRYSISGDTNKEKIQSYANYLDQKLRELAGEVGTESRYKLAILCNLNIIEELFVLKDKLAETEDRLTRIEDLLQSLSQDI